MNGNIGKTGSKPLPKILFALVQPYWTIVVPMKKYACLCLLVGKLISMQIINDKIQFYIHLALSL